MEIVIVLAPLRKHGPNQPYTEDRTLSYSAFTADNDPYAEHDFGSFQFAGETIFWKFDYYDLDLTMHSPDAADPEVTARVLTVLLGSEY